jgi:hypothetical protein
VGLRLGVLLPPERARGPARAGTVGAVRPRTLFIVFVLLWGLALGALEASDSSDAALVVLLGAVAAQCVVALLGVAALVASLVVRRREGASGTPGVRLVLTVAACLAGALAAALGAYLFVPVPPSQGALENSVERETGSAGLAGDCIRDAASRWRCEVTDGQGSGAATYEVTTDGTCWRGRRTSADSATETPMPARAAGCTRLQDRYPVLPD